MTQIVGHRSSHRSYFYTRANKTRFADWGGQGQVGQQCRTSRPWLALVYTVPQHSPPSASQEIPCNFCNPKVQKRLHNSAPLVLPRATFTQSTPSQPTFHPILILFPICFQLSVYMEFQNSVLSPTHYCSLCNQSQFVTRTAVPALRQCSQSKSLSLSALCRSVSGVWRGEGL